MELKLTTKSQEALAAAVQAATTNGNPNVEPVHLLAALAAQPGGVPAGLLEAVGAQPAQIVNRAKAAIAAIPSVKGSTVAAPQLSRNAQGILIAAQEEMSALGDSFVSTEHLLLALAADRGPRVRSCVRQAPPPTRSRPRYRRSEVAPRSTPPIRKARSRLWRSTPSTSPSRLATASSTP